MERHALGTELGVWRANEAGEKPLSVSFFSLGKRFAALRRKVVWLPEYIFEVVRYTLKYRADAWRAYFKDVTGNRDSRSSIPSVATRRHSRYPIKSISKTGDS